MDFVIIRGDAAIMGMEYIAMDMCEALTALGIHVCMVKPSSRFLP